MAIVLRLLLKSAGICFALAVLLEAILQAPVSRVAWTLVWAAAVGLALRSEGLLRWPPESS